VQSLDTCGLTGRLPCPATPPIIRVSGPRSQGRKIHIGSYGLYGSRRRVRLAAGGIEVTALHNHLLRNQPFTMYMHVQGNGDPVKLATALHAALAETKTPLATSSAAPAAAPPPIDLDTAAIDQILGAKGTDNGGIYQFGIPRAEPIKDDGMDVPPPMGSANSINFSQPVAARRRSPVISSSSRKR